ncbi:SDR family oxidoreductase [Candidatus Thioglobus sp.]|nr:SDR family oxidoreductase [Candidatus Thioglobus sp.]
MSNLLNGKLAVVTGANRGIGRSIIETFAENRCDIFACMREVTLETKKWLKNLENKFNIVITPIELDLSDEDSIKNSIKQIFSISKRIDILVNNAGIASGGLFQMTPLSELRKVFEINLFSQILFTQGIAKIMIRNKCGSIINLSSSAAFIADPGTLSYGSSKSALIRATESMAMELGALNIRVNAIAPGVTKTDMFDQMSKDARDKLINSSSLKRPAEPKDIANVALFLASELSSFVTGQVIRADGGIT